MLYNLAIFFLILCLGKPSHTGAYGCLLSVKIKIENFKWPPTKEKEKEIRVDL